MKRIITSLAIAGLLLGVGGVALATQEEKVTICHRTDSVTNPYNKIKVNASAVDGEGNNDHTKHTGPVATSQAVAQSLKDEGKKWGDIIPDKLNWTTEGQAVYDNECEYPPEDVCPNIEGIQEEVPEGKELKDGQCVDKEEPKEEETPPVETPPTTPPTTVEDEPIVVTEGK